MNTNATFDGNAYKEMLATPKAAAYYDRKTAVDSIQRGDRVFLYHTRVGIIAAGRATESIRVGDRDGDAGEEHFIPLRLDFRADPLEEPHKCVAAWEINRALGTTPLETLNNARVCEHSIAGVRVIENAFKKKLVVGRETELRSLRLQLADRYIGGVDRTYKFGLDKHNVWEAVADVMFGHALSVEIAERGLGAC